ncbi:hypothetical protein [Bradyrhizobium ganzhouense]|uniref:hypothetical protein n=1 Tax=Bradyrhizobium ganzhouense TaxID=1179767 RepID=UPI003CF69CF8
MLIWIILLSPWVALLGIVLWDSDRDALTTKLPAKAWAAIIMLIAALIFQPQIADLISRTKAIKIDVSKRTAEAEFGETVQKQIAEIGELEKDTKAIVDAASVSLDRSIIVAWKLLEGKIRRLLAATHWNEGVYVDVRHGFETLVSLGVLAKNDLNNLKVLEDEYVRVTSHKAQGDKSASTSAVITAIQLLKGLHSIALQDNIVEATSIKLYSDPSCKSEIVGATGLLIKQVMVEGLETRYGVFPTTRTDYKVGEHLTWDWNLSRIWREFCFKNPRTGAVERGAAAEFVGSDIDSLR